MVNMRLYHNPRCSKSREAIAILESKNIQFDIINYLSNGIINQDLDLLCKLDGIIRTNEKEFRENPVDITNFRNVRSLLSNHPKLLQRPVLVSGGKAVIGRPPEEILILLP